jgi:hypothetical protein
VWWLVWNSMPIDFGGSTGHSDDLLGVSFERNFPSEEARERLLDEHHFQHAVRVCLGALPAVSVLGVRDGSEAKFGLGLQSAADLEELDWSIDGLGAATAPDARGAFP